MFHSARIKLTFWYTLILMFISIFFSLIIYTQINQDYNRIEHSQKLRQELFQKGLAPTFEQFRQQRIAQGLDVPQIPQAFDPKPVTEARTRLLLILILINLFILGIAGGAGYFLAGRTLKPIKDMVDEQNRFIADSSHELRTPLTALRTEIEVNLRDKKLSLKEAKKVLKNNLLEVIGLQNLSDSLLALAKVENGTNGLNKNQIYLRQVINQAIDKVTPLAKEKDIKIEKKVANIQLLADEEKIARLLLILLDNAIKYSPKGKQVKINAKRIDQRVKIEIIDQGIGISSEDLPDIFDRFYRVDKSRSLTEGYGLGLSIAKQIVEQHQGIIEADSKLGEGSIFSVYL